LQWKKKIDPKSPKESKQFPEKDSQRPETHRMKVVSKERFFPEKSKKIKKTRI